MADRAWTPTSLAALVAAALEGQAIDGVELHGALGSLKEIVERNWRADEKPELFVSACSRPSTCRSLPRWRLPTRWSFPTQASG